MISHKQFLANRDNAKRCTGPKTVEGKEHVKYNALKHGFRCTSLVIMPNEDPDEYTARVGDWLTDLRPANAAEENLIRHAADLSWLIDRAKWQEGQLLYQQVSDAMARAERAGADRHRDALRKLLPTAAEAASSRLDPTDARQLRTLVETTADGCHHLLSVWQGLRASVQAGQPWDDEQELHVIRLLGFGHTAINDPDMLDVLVANRLARDPKLNEYSWRDGPFKIYFGYSAGPKALTRKPANVPQAFALMVKTADDEIARLANVLAERDRAPDAAQVINPATTHAITGTSVDVEKMRKYREVLSRELFRTLDVLGKVRKEQESHRKEMRIGANEAISGEASAVEEGDRHADYREPVPVSAPNEPISTPERDANEAIVQVMNAIGDDRAAKIAAPTVPAEAAEAPPANRWERRRRAALARQATESKKGR
jgi:hypothetical protein